MANFAPLSYFLILTDTENRQTGCQAVQPYQQSYTYNRSFSCKFSTGSGAVDFVNALLTASGNEASDANKGWQFCKTRSGIRMGQQLIVSGLDTDTSGGGRYRWLGFEVQQYIRMPKTLGNLLSNWHIEA